MSLKSKITFSQFIEKHLNIIFVILTLLTGFFIVLPFANFQAYLAQGDHGRDLYGYWIVYQGGLPYRDFTHLFGPLMPEYYALMFKLFGVKIQSVLLGQNILIVLNGFLVYQICRQFGTNFFAYTFSLMYWGFRDIEFFYTYNHTGGLTAILLLVYALIRYLNSYEIRYLYVGFFSSTLLMLIRLNMGIAFWFGFGFCVLLIHGINQKPITRTVIKHLLRSAIIFVIPVIFIYWQLLHDLPDYVLRQSFPWGSNQRSDATSSPLQALFLLRQWLLFFFTQSKLYIFEGWLIILGLLYTAQLTLTKKFNNPEGRKLLTQLVILAALITIGLHEYLTSGVHYRVEWVGPICYVFLASLLASILQKGHKIFNLKIIQTFILFGIILFSYLKFSGYYEVITKSKTPGQYLNWNGTKIFTTQDPSWFNTVYSTLNFIDRNIPANEPILCAPYDALYLFLTQHKSPSREVMIFKHFRISPEQDQAIADNLEKKHVNWVILSNRAISSDPGLGILGKDYCPKLESYLEKNFKIAAKIGPWNGEDSWAWNHGTRILKRK
ncbi:MAG: glycosyltransferase family 39 protein [Candidatus Omnitrophica bacterium]|nr:glycosyltransferase family 39 protein [Candidatus Omnitrophota bacterium]